MPGFFESLGRMAKGEPIFQSDDNDGQPSSSKPQEEAIRETHSDRTDGKTVPTVVITKVECDIDGAHMTICAEVTNHSSEAVYVDKAIIMGTHRDLDRNMRAGEEHEFFIFDGLRPIDTHQTQAELHFRNQAGDYFASIHYVEFKQLQDGMLAVDELKYLPPIKDI